MVNESNLDSRLTFILDPGQGDRLQRSDLLAHAAYYASRGFDRNFLVWSRQDENYFPPAGARWAGCAFPGSPPACTTIDFSLVRAGVVTGAIPSFVHGNAFIARGCGNFSEERSTPMPRLVGVKYEDVNGNGQRDSGEPGVGNWTMHLYRGNDHVDTTTTDSDGTYTFWLDATRGLGPGTYHVREAPRANWEQSSANPPAVDVPFGAGSNVYQGGAFGNYRPATIVAIKYEDMDADGDRDADDPLLSDWTMHLGEGHSAPQTQVTGAGGAATFSGLRPDDYSVSEDLQTGWRYSNPADGRHDLNVRSGDSVTVQLGNYRPATIEGVKFDDHDVDGVRDPDEPGLAGWTITLSGGRSPGTSVVTGADGRYAFDGLIPDEYAISETLQPHWRQSAPLPPSAWETASHSVRVRSGDRKSADFGNVCLGTAEVQITDEDTGATITGVKVRIEEIDVPGILENEPKLPLTTTGTPTFADLLPGTYRVIAFLPDGVYTTDRDVHAVDGDLAVVKEITIEECETTVVPIKMFRQSNGKVTGGMKMVVDGGYATAGFVFMTRQGNAEGSLEYQDHQDEGADLNLHTDAIERIRVVGREAWIGGLVEIDGAVHRFLLHLVDEGEPGSEDRFELLVANGYDVGREQTIIGGNDQVHPPQETT